MTITFTKKSFLLLGIAAVVFAILAWLPLSDYMGYQESTNRMHRLLGLASKWQADRSTANQITESLRASDLTSEITTMGDKDLDGNPCLTYQLKEVGGLINGRGYSGQILFNSSGKFLGLTVERDGTYL